MASADRKAVLDFQRELSLRFDGRSFADSAMTLAFLCAALVQSQPHATENQDTMLEAMRILVRAIITSHPRTAGMTMTRQ